MDDFAKQCGIWLSLNVKFCPTGDLCKLFLLAKDDSLSYLYVQLIFPNGSQVIFPANSRMSSAISRNKLTLVFQFFEVKCFDIECESSIDANLLHTQISLCSSISMNDSFPFYQAFLLFLQHSCRPILQQTFASPLLPLFPVAFQDEPQKTWVRRSKLLNLPFFTDLKPIKAAFFTWNVEQKIPDAQTYRQIEFIFYKQTDLIFVALQEIDFSAHAIIFGESGIAPQWSTVLTHASESFNYESFAEATLGGVFFKAFRRKDFNMAIKVNRINSIRFGASGMAANKSAITCEFSIESSRFAVIAAHLMSDPRSSEIRARQIEDSLSSLRQKSDFTIFFGDLNFRVDTSFSDAITKVKDGTFIDLLEKDQLRNLLRTTLSKFKEGEILFRPTFKFDDYSTVYDSSPKHRTPSWTDRVLVMTSDPRICVGYNGPPMFETDTFFDFFKDGSKTLKAISQIPPNYPTEPRCLLYRSYDVQYSDHRPVSAEYEFIIAAVNKEKYSCFDTVIEQRLNALNGLSVPDVSLTPRDFEMDRETELSIENNGLVPAIWKIETIPSGCGAEPSGGELMPHDKVKITLTCRKIYKESQLGMILIEGGSPIFFQFKCSSNS